MPGEAYSNPSFIPPIFGYTWSPKTNANGNAQAQGFYQARIGRGRFFNAAPDINNDDTTKTRVKVTGTYITGQEYYPIQNVFRPLQNPNNYISLPPSDYIDITNKLDGDTIQELLSYAVTIPTSKRIASIQLEYSFVVDPEDTTFLDSITNEEDKKNIESGNFGNIDLSKYLYLDVLLDGKVYTSKTGDKADKLLPLTGLSTGVSFITKQLRLEETIASGLSSANYPQAKEIKLIPNKQIKSLKLHIKKFSIYEAINSCNIDDRNLPSIILSYAVLVDCEVDTSDSSSATFKVPSTFQNRPTINVKVFNPDSRIQSPGFSHSVDLRFFCAATPIDPGVGAALGNVGGEGTFFVTLLNVGVGRRHARYVFDGATLSSGIKKLTEFALYSKKETVNLSASGNSNDKDISDASLGIFIATDEKYPLPINTGITFTKGTFKTAFDGSVSFKDSDATADNSVNHVYFRYWFVPVDVNTSDADVVRSYREKTEFIFKVIDGFTTVSRQAPSSFLDLLVSPPLDINSQTFEIARYINVQKKLTFPDIDFSSAVLAVEVFVKTNSTDDTKFTNFPTINFSASSEASGIESNIFQNISNTLYPMRSFDLLIFLSSKFSPLKSPLNLTNLLTGNRKAVENNGYIEYSQKFTSATANSTVENAFKDLLVINPTSQAGKINATLTEQVFNSLKKTSQVTNSSSLINIDFVTDGDILSNGRVNTGTWTIKLNRKNIDKDLGFDLQIQGLMISSNGKVLSRLFKSPLLTDKEEISYSPTINIPFNIESVETQFVLRVSLYPYSSGKYSYSELVSSASKEGLKPGFKFESIVITKHTLERMYILANNDASGSPGFNEDLPIAPVKVLGNDPEIDGQFFFIASEESLGTKTVSTSNPFKVSGTLYSPTWFVSMPENSEVKLNSSFAGSSSAKILFRSVIGGAQAVEDSVSVTTSRLSGNITVAYNSNRADVNESGEVDVVSVYGRNGMYESYNVKSNPTSGDFNTNAETSFKGKNPLIINFQPVDNDDKANADMVYLLSESSDNTGIFSSVAVNNAGSNQKTWQLPGNDFFQSKEGFTIQKQLFNHLTFTSAFMDQIRNSVYAVGYVEGSLILKTTQAFSASSGNPGVSTFLIAGPTPDPLSTEFYPNFKNLQNVDSDPIAQTYPNIIGFERNRFIIFYVAQGNKSIKYKILDGNVLTEERTVIDLNTILGSSSSSISISGLTTVLQKSNNIIHLAFWCNSKIFYLSFSSFVDSPVNMMPLLQLVAGNFIPDKANNQLIYDLSQIKYVVLNNDDPDDNSDVPQQRLGLTMTSDHINEYLIAWYKDTNNKIVSKTIHPYTTVFDKKVYEVFSQ
jgi:hypothetical protein